MATQTEYVATAPFPSGVAIGASTSTRQWMTPSGFYLDEQISGGGGSTVNPVVQTCG